MNTLCTPFSKKAEPVSPTGSVDFIAAKSADLAAGGEELRFPEIASQFPGGNLTGRYRFASACATAKPNPPHMSPDLILQAARRNVCTHPLRLRRLPLVVPTALCRIRF